MILLLVNLALAADCPDLGDSINGIAAALNDVDLDTARELARKATTGLECQQKPISPVMLTSLFQLAGSVELYMGEEADALELYARGVAVSPMAQIDSLLGEDCELAYEAVRKKSLETAGGTLRIDGQVEAWLDGRSVSTGVELDVSAGGHLLQWREGPEEPMQARVARVETREARVLPLGSQAAVPAPAAPAAPAATPAPVEDVATSGGGTGQTNMARMGALGGGAVGLVVGGVLIASAGLSHRSFDNETDPNELSGLQTRTNVLTVAGIGLGVVGLAVGGVGFVLLEDGAGVTWSRRW